MVGVARTWATRSVHVFLFIRLSFVLLSCGVEAFYLMGISFMLISPRSLAVRRFGTRRSPFIRALVILDREYWDEFVEQRQGTKKNQ